MKRFVKKLKSLFVYLLVILININIYAAIVADGDSSALVTRAEFEIIKNNISNQINEYSSNSDSKIDGAIATYLANMKNDKPEEVAWEIGGGEKCLLLNSGTINDLAWGKANVDLALSQCAISGATGQPASYMYYNLKRNNNTYPYEVFNIDSEQRKFLSYYPQAQLNVKGQMALNHNGGTDTFTSVASSTTIYLRWHAQPWGSGYLYRGELQRTGANGSYSDRLFDGGFSAIYCTRINMGIWYSSSSTQPYYEKWTASANWSLPNNEENTIKYCFENSNNATSIWSLPFNNDDGLKQVVAKWTAPYKASSTAMPSSYNTPSAAGIETTGGVKAIGKQGAVSYTWSWTSNPVWTTTGTYNSSSGTNTALPWYEFTLENPSVSGKNLINANYSEIALNKYSPYGWTGKLEQGMPIGEFEEEKKVEFTIDTTELSNSAIIAFDTVPFAISTTALDDWPHNNKFDLYVDDVKKTGSAAELSSDTHQIKIEFNDTKNKKALFWKMSYKKDYTGTARETITIPRTYVSTKNVSE